MLEWYGTSLDRIRRRRSSFGTPGREGFGDACDCCPQAVDGPLSGLAQGRRELGEGHLDGVEWGRQEEQRDTGYLDVFAELWSLVAGQVVHDDDFAGAQFGDQHLVDTGLGSRTVDRRVEHEGRDHASEGEPGDEGCGLPMAVRLAHAQAPASWRAAAGTGHVGLGPSLVDEDQGRNLKVGLACAPCLPALETIRATLLTRVARLPLARHPAADEEALDRAVAQAQPAPGEQVAQLLDGDVGGLGQHAEDEGAMRLDASRPTVSAQRARGWIARHHGPPAPLADLYCSSWA